MASSNYSITNNLQLYGFKYSYLMLIILFNNKFFRWYHIFLFNTNNFQTDRFDPCRTLTGTTTLSQGEPGSNGTEGVLHRASELES